MQILGRGVIAPTAPPESQRQKAVARCNAVLLAEEATRQSVAVFQKMLSGNSPNDVTALSCSYYAVVYSALRN